MATDGPVSDSIEEPSTVTNKVLRHSTISQDASSGGPLFAEKLAPLTQPLDRIQPNKENEAKHRSKTRLKASAQSLGRDGGKKGTLKVVEPDFTSKRHWRYTIGRSRDQHDRVTEDYNYDSEGSSSNEPKSSSVVDEDEGDDLEDLSRRRLLALFKDLKIRYETLEKDGTPGKPQQGAPPVPHSTWRTFYCIGDSHEAHDIYLEQPQWKNGQSGPVLVAESPLRHVDSYLDQHPEISFMFFNFYSTRPPTDIYMIMTKEGIFKPPRPYRQSLRIESPHLLGAVENMEEQLPEIASLFPDFNPEKRISAPYLVFFYSIPLLSQVKPHLTILQDELLNQLVDGILENYGKEYVAARRLAAEGMTTQRLLKYLVKPGDVLVTRLHGQQAYMATSWAAEERTEDGAEEDEWSPPSQRQTRHSGQRNAHKTIGGKTFTWRVNVWFWDFDGVFQRTADNVVLRMRLSGSDTPIRIDSLPYFPLEYADQKLHSLLERRGKIFWGCRLRKYISCGGDAKEDLSDISERYMVDTITYNNLHPSLSKGRKRLHDDIGSVRMRSDDPPEGDELLLFPSKIKGYELRRKKWVDLHVDRIQDVVWNKQAFESLVVNPRTKELVQALVTNQLAAHNSTDLILGKGNGLTILLHGGPGTGKTFTAEGVAELAEKPLFRVTCGDVGTEPERVEAYLEAAFTLGKTWDCVVLLDEADVFLEERGLADLQRNALVSVFLRVLEYNVGILILTSNRVGSFDEAFKSRIQLALHYRNLTIPQQKKIWRNFLARLKSLDEENTDFEDLTDHVDELGKFDMNGRQIRNAITTARQLALYKGTKFCYEHLRQAIEVGGEFEEYLRELRQGLSDDQLKKDEQLRH